MYDINSSTKSLTFLYFKVILKSETCKFSILLYILKDKKLYYNTSVSVTIRVSFCKHYGQQIVANIRNVDIRARKFNLISLLDYFAVNARLLHIIKIIIIIDV